MTDHDDSTMDPAVRHMLEEPEACLKDDGFVQAVMERVPQPALATPVTRRVVVFGLSALAACVTTWLSMSELLPLLTPVSCRHPADFAPMTGLLVIGSGVLLAALYPVAESLGRAFALRRER